MQKDNQTKNGSGLTSALRTPRGQNTRFAKQSQFESGEESASRKQPQAYADATDRDITFYIDVELPESTEIPKVMVTVAPDCFVSQAVIKAIEKFNTEYASHNIELPLDVTLYAPRLPKKNGKPKTDMPSLDLKQKIFQTRVFIVSIQIKDKQAMLAAKNSMSTAIDNQQEKSRLIESDIQFEKKQVEIKPEERTQKKGLCFSSVC